MNILRLRNIPIYNIIQPAAYHLAAQAEESRKVIELTEQLLDITILMLLVAFIVCMIPAFTYIIKRFQE